MGSTGTWFMLKAIAGSTTLRSVRSSALDPLVQTGPQASLASGLITEFLHLILPAGASTATGRRDRLRAPTMGCDAKYYVFSGLSLGYWTRSSLERADVHDRDAVAVAVLLARDRAALVGGRHAGVVARVDGPAAGQQGVGLRRPAVVGQRAELGVDGMSTRADDVAVDAVGEARAADAVADEVVPQAGEWRTHQSGPVPPKLTRFRATIVFLTLNIPGRSGLSAWKRPPPV